MTVRPSTNWNSRRIAAEVRRRGIDVSHGQIDPPFDRYGLHRHTTARVPGPRYERGAPNELCGTSISRVRSTSTL